MSDNKLTVLGEGEIPCMIFPMEGYQMLVPTVTVAEMSPIKPLQSVADVPDWLMGLYEWRNLKVPVISFDTLNGSERREVNPFGRIAVLNTTGATDKLSFVGLHTQGIPRMTRVGPDDIKENESAQKRTFELMAVTVGLESFVIPDVTALETACSQLDITY